MPIYIGKNEINEICAISDKIIKHKVEEKHKDDDALYFIYSAISIIAGVVIFVFSCKFTSLGLESKIIRSCFIFLSVILFILGSLFLFKILKKIISDFLKFGEKSTDDVNEYIKENLISDAEFVNEFRKFSINSLKLARSGYCRGIDLHQAYGSILSGEIIKIGIAPIMVSAVGAELTIWHYSDGFVRRILIWVPIALVTWSFMNASAVRRYLGVKRVVDILDCAINSIKDDES